MSTLVGWYSVGVIITFLIAVIPCWVSQYDSSASLVINLISMLIAGTLFGVVIAACWPVAIPMTGVIWWAAAGTTGTRLTALAARPSDTTRLKKP